MKKRGLGPSFFVLSPLGYNPNMADLTDIQAAESVKIIGSTSTGVETTPVKSRPNGDLAVSDLLTVGGTQANLVVGTTAVEVKVGANKLTNRKLVTVLPVDSVLYFGWSIGVTTSTGTPIQKNQLAQFAIDDTATLYLISATAAKNARITESP